MSTLVDMKSLLNSHERPFLVIDRNYCIVGVNDAFTTQYATSREAVLGRRCYEVSHGDAIPCHMRGEDCPHLRVYRDGTSHSCLHQHKDSRGRLYQVRVTMHPIQGRNGEIYAGEVIDELSILDQDDGQSVRMVGASPIFLRALEQLKSAAQYDAPVLLQGETGTGKELAANFIHEHSARRETPFLTLDCTLLSESLFESEVFGHERGAFTGSVGQRTGLFELADGGTLFLDEVGETSPSTQSKMLRVLESGEFRRLGGHETRRSNARIVCATNRDLKSAEWFRKDLYYRVACLSVELPSLRERLEDLPLLARAALDRIASSTGRDYRLTDGALKRLRQYHFPGNIRELRNILWAAATRCHNGQIEGSDIEFQPEPKGSHQERPVRRQPTTPQGGQDGSMPVSRHASIEELEAGLIADLLAEHDGNRRRVAAELDISERTLYRKLRRFGLN